LTSWPDTKSRRKCRGRVEGVVHSNDGVATGRRQRFNPQKRIAATSTTTKISKAEIHYSVMVEVERVLMKRKNLDVGWGVYDLRLS
jgi:hypothetical protein